MFDENTAAFVQNMLLRLPVVLFALTVHEYMHGYVAYLCGDDTAQRAGRLTLNPLAHLDPIGTLALMFAPIGWAKPVPVNRANFDYETRKRSEILVSIAGVSANLVMGIVVALVLRFTILRGTWIEADWGKHVFEMARLAVLVNFGLAVFNLLPIPPLDGSHVLEHLLPLNLAIRFNEMRRYGVYLLLAFVFFNAYVHPVLWYPIEGLVRVFGGSAALLWWPYDVLTATESIM